MPAGTHAGASTTTPDAPPFSPPPQLEHPYKLLAVQGVDDLLAHASAAVLPVVPQLVLPVRQALNTRIPEVILTVMDALEKLLLCDRLAPGGPVIGRALVPYYRQILPVMNIFLTANVNRGDAIEYGQRHRAVIGDRILGVRRGSRPWRPRSLPRHGPACLPAPLRSPCACRC